MKKAGIGMTLVLAAIASATSASAARIELASIDTNNCARAESEVRLLNGADSAVSTYCESGFFRGKNGVIYNERLHTAVEVPFDVYMGDSVALASIDTENCAAARSEIALLQSGPVQVVTNCQYGEFEGLNGAIYDERLVTRLIIRDDIAVSEDLF